ncbi:MULTISPECIES: hypothetical protein [unclassified Moorena]|nr:MULTISPECIES: hypothetical protein [unclassified Moorena]NEP34361.1 hypothetical protein [Moorena sp. SIO3B2]NEQ06665.1 hypothetical protein [Moorena sp. SIO4E2]
MTLAFRPRYANGHAMRSLFYTVVLCDQASAPFLTIPVKLSFAKYTGYK